jgi:hypothetical protein
MLLISVKDNKNKVDIQLLDNFLNYLKLKINTKEN